MQTNLAINIEFDRGRPGADADPPDAAPREDDVAAVVVEVKRGGLSVVAGHDLVAVECQVGAVPDSD